MNRRNILTIPAITALGLVILSGTAIAQTKSLKDQLVATWTVASWEQVFKDGTKRQDFGPNPKGVASFDLTFWRVVPHLPKAAGRAIVHAT